MQKLHVTKNSNITVASNLPVKITSPLFSDRLEVQEVDYNNVLAGTHKVEIDGQNQVNFIEKPSKPLDPTIQQKADLKAKLESGTATDADIKEALKLLL